MSLTASSGSVSFAVQLAAAPPVIVRRMQLALAAFAILALGVAWPGVDAARRLPFGVFAAIAAGAIVARLHGAGRRNAEGVLHIDAAGQACWRGIGQAPATPVQVRQWHVLGRMAWLRLHVLREPGIGVADDRIDVLFWRRSEHGHPSDARGPDERGAGAAEDEWRRFRAWLLWYGRGAAVTIEPVASAVDTRTAAAGSG